jgi:thiosulfate/3-mercaptopyruvate sulfurtransferase
VVDELPFPPGNIPGTLLEVFIMRTYPSGDTPVKWISAEWLKDRLDDEEIIILDVQPNVHDYITGHIPHAIYMNEGLLRSASESLPAVYVLPESIQPVLSCAGIEPDIPVIVYSGAGRYSKCTRGLGDGLEQPMMAYTLLRYGLRQVYILDGGIEKWKDSGGQLTKAYPICQRSDFPVRVRKDFFVEYGEFKRTKDNPDVVVFDARPTEFYEESKIWPKSGHIPGAISLPWRNFMTEENPRLLKPDEEIRGMVANTGLTQDKMVYIYCGTGREATNEFLILKWYIGHDKVKIYEGSFTEWTAHPENPTVTCKNPL